MNTGQAKLNAFAFLGFSLLGFFGFLWLDGSLRHFLGRFRGAGGDGSWGATGHRGWGFGDGHDDASAARRGDDWSWASATASGSRDNDRSRSGDDATGATGGGRSGAVAASGTQAEEAAAVAAVATHQAETEETTIATVAARSWCRAGAASSHWGRCWSGRAGATCDNAGAIAAAEQFAIETRDVRRTRHRHHHDHCVHRPQPPHPDAGHGEKKPLARGLSESTRGNVS
jgi:hypothetical protein